MRPNRRRSSGMTAPGTSPPPAICFSAQLDPINTASPSRTSGNGRGAAVVREGSAMPNRASPIAISSVSM